MRLTFLGTGTSTGIPAIGCRCKVCTSIDERDKRLRTSALLTTDEGRNLLIDCGPDFRKQILAAGSPPLDALLITHIHFDHVGGIEDLRPYCYGRPDGRGFPVYCDATTERGLRERLPYCFAADHYPGAPVFDMHRLEAGRETTAAGTKVLPLRVMHAPGLPILGFRFGRLAYITDCKTLPCSTLKALHGVDTLVINALRIKEHGSHMNLQQAIDVINCVTPRKAYLIHLSHDMGLHSQVALTLPEHIEIATDGMTIEI